MELMIDVGHVGNRQKKLRQCGEVQQIQYTVMLQLLIKTLDDVCNTSAHITPLIIFVVTVASQRTSSSLHISSTINNRARVDQLTEVVHTCQVLLMCCEIASKYLLKV